MGVAFAVSPFGHPRVRQSVVRACVSQPAEERHDVPKRSRRALIRDASVIAAVLAASAIAPPSADAGSLSGRQVVNGVLSGYGLPTLPDMDGMNALLEQYDRLIVEIQYPSDWVVARNVIASSQNSADMASSKRLSFGSSTEPMEGRGAGITVGDYRKAEGVSFYVSSDVPKGISTNDIPAATILNLVTPGDASGLAEYTLVKDTVNPETGYRLITSKYESTTLSGYNVQRRGITSATVLNGKLYCLAGTCSETRMKKIGDKLRASVESFRVYRL